MKCPACRKWSFRTRERAEERAREITKDYNRGRSHSRRMATRMRVYLCPRGSGWHLSRIKTLVEHREKARSRESVS